MLSDNSVPYYSNVKNPDCGIETFFIRIPQRNSENRKVGFIAFYGNSCYSNFISDPVLSIRK